MKMLHLSERNTYTKNKQSYCWHNKAVNYTDVLTVVSEWVGFNVRSDTV